MNSELSIVMKIARGDRSAFRIFVDAYKRDIISLAFSMTGSLEDAEDISQDVFVKVFRNSGSFKGDSQVKSWLYRITVNTCLDKKKKKAFSSLEYQDTNDLDDRSVDVKMKQAQSDLRTIESDFDAHVEKAVQKLSARERAVFAMKHNNDLKLSEIAEILEISLGTVKSIMFRAIQKLREELSYLNVERI